jgi:hypothetical protein
MVAAITVLAIFRPPLALSPERAGAGSVLGAASNSSLAVVAGALDAISAEAPGGLADGPRWHAVAAPKTNKPLARCRDRTMRAVV